MWCLLTCLVFVVNLATIVAAPPAPQSGVVLPELLARLGHRVEEWYNRAQRIVSREDVSIQSLRSDLTPSDSVRRLTYELRVAWDPEGATAGTLPEANVVRQIMRVNGRQPRARDEPGCIDPKPVSQEPLTMLLARRRDQYNFSMAGTTRVSGRPAIMLDYKSAAAAPATVRWEKDCITVELPGQTKGRIWIDAATYDVLRLDEHLVGLFEFRVPPEHMRPGSSSLIVLERADSSIQYRRVQFQDPEDTLMLPAAVDTVTIFRGSGISRTRIIQQFSDYRRFLTDGRVVR